MKYIYNIKFKLVVLLMMVSGAMQAQEVTVSGKITDGESTAGLPGVNVIQQGTSTGTVSDIDGNYKIAVSTNSTLIFSFVGYATEQIQVNGRSVIDVSMSPDITQLSEVVVVGYGEQEQEDLTGVVTAVTSEDFNKGAIVSPDNLISGKISGVNVVSNGGEPGAGVNIRIRGTSSIEANKEPLFVIDGVPVDNAGLGSGRNPLNFLNPSDIESFTVLKDASAAAIYGSRGTNGVILISTKKGTVGRPSLTYNTWYSVANSVDKTDVLTGPEYRTVVAAQAPNRSELLLNANTDWQAQILRQAEGQNHELGLTGGSEDLSYRFSLGYLEQEGIIKSSKTEKITTSINLNTKALDDRVKVNFSMNNAYTQDDFQDGGAIGSAIEFAPSQPVHDANNRFGGYWEWPESFGTAIILNPVSQIEQTQDKGEVYRSLGNLKVDYDVHGIDGLTATVLLGYDVLSGERNRFQPTTLRSQLSSGGTIFQERNKRVNKLFDFYVNYARELESINSSFDVMVGYEYQDRKSEFPKITGNQLSTNAFGFESLPVATEFKPEIGIEPQRIKSYFGRFNYSFADKYLITATVRNDGSSNFGPKNQTGWFPSVGAGWRVSEEDFMSNLDLVSNLKLRGSYGTLGNQDFKSFVFVSTYDPGGPFVRYQFGDRFVSTIRPSERNEEIKWEETTQLNIGLDFELFDGRINGSFDYYNKQTKDLILNTPVPAGTNLSNFVVSNVGELENKGIELTLNGTAIRSNDLRWDLSLNLARNTNEIKTLINEGADIPIGGISGGVGSNIQLIREGEAISSFYTYRHKRGADGKPLVDGVDHNEDGDIDDADIYEDTNGDGEVNLDDRVISGNPNPDLIVGLTSNLRYKNFDLSFTIRGAFGNETYNNVASSNGNYSKAVSDIVPGNMHRSVLDNNFQEPLILSDVYIEDGSFIKMDNISLGYQVPKLPANMKLRIYGTVQNVFSFTDYSGIDPETRLNYNENGIDNNLYPRSTTFLVGLNLGL